MLVTLLLNRLRFLLLLPGQPLLEVPQLSVGLGLSLSPESLLLCLPLGVPLSLFTFNVGLVLGDELLFAQLKIAVNLLQTLFELLFEKHLLFLHFFVGFGPDQRVLLLVEEGGFAWVLLGLGLGNQLFEVVVKRVVVDDLAGHSVAVVDVLVLVRVHLPGLGHGLFQLQWLDRL